jgi:putative transposase
VHGFGLPRNQYTIRFLVFISQDRNILVAEAFLKSLVKLWKTYRLSNGGTWYPEACNSLGLTHIHHPPFEEHY